MSQRARVAVIAAAVVAAAVGFAIASSGGDDKGSKRASTTAQPTASGTGTKANRPKPVVRIVVKGGKPVGGVRKIVVNKGDPVRFSVASDVADEVHVHGYDFHKNVPKGGSATFSFPAKVDGSFVIELETRGEQIASLEVQP